MMAFMIARRFPRAALVLATTLVSVASVCVVACSGSEASTFKDVPDAEPVVDTDANTTFGEDAGPDDGGVCAPSAITGFTAKYRAPAAPNLTACTAAQLDGYYAACLTQPLDEKKCTDFTAALGTCGTCLDTSDTAGAFGPVIWHDQDKYFTVNIPGCIALKQQDTGTAGCGAAYESLLQCNRRSCESCLVGVSATFKKFTDCQRDAKTTTCLDYYKKESAACAKLSTGTPADICIPPAGSTLKDAFKLIAPIFCGGQQ
jgi:hypothetical protein